MQTLENFNSIPAPRIIAQGKSAQLPPYLILSEIPGSTTEHVWDALSRSVQIAVAQELGTVTAAIHQLPRQDLTAVEQQFGGWHQHVKEEQSRRFPLIKATDTLSQQHRTDMIRFLEEETPELLDNTLKVTHCELAHNHIYLIQEMDSWKISGVIDWANAMLGPPERDVAFLWFWTFSRDQEAMRVCPQALYADKAPPERFARRCLAAILHTHSMPALWAEFAEHGNGSNPIEHEMTKYLFPTDLLGSCETDATAAAALFAEKSRWWTFEAKPVAVKRYPWPTGTTGRGRPVRHRRAVAKDGLRQSRPCTTPF